MPRQKDLKRVVRTRMEKTGESYTTARMHVTRKREPEPDYALLAGMSDTAVKTRTGRDWREWTSVLDAHGCASKPHREIAKLVHSLGVGSWWSQSVTVGYERIRGLRAIGQRSSGDFEASKSRTFAVPVAKAFDAFAKPARRKRWLPPGVTLRSATPPKRARLSMEDGTVVEVYFLEKGPAKCSVAIQHSRLADRSAAAASKAWWADRLEALAQQLLT